GVTGCLLAAGLDNRFDFDGEVKGERGNTDSGSGRAADVAEGVYEQVRGTVRDKVLVGEVWRRIHEYDELQDSGHAGEFPEFRFHRCEEVEHDGLGSGTAFVRGEVGA